LLFNIVNGHQVFALFITSEDMTETQFG
jgi:hypothetical protein